MVMWLSNRGAREKLFARGRVYVLRSKPHVGTDKLTKGEEDLVWDIPTPRDHRVKYTFLKKIKSDEELREYLANSGFQSIEEWRKDQKGKSLFMLKLVDFIKKTRW